MSISRIKTMVAMVACLILQDARAQTPVPPSVVTVQFRLLAWDAGIPEIIYKSGGKAVDLKLVTFEPTDEQSYTGPREMEFFRHQDSPDGRKLAEAGSVVLSPDVKKVLLLLFPQADSTYRIVSVPDDLDHFPRGQARLFNGTPYRLAIKTDHDLIQLEPGETRLAGGSDDRLLIHIACFRDGRWTKAGNNVFEMNASMRQSLFFVSSNSETFRGSAYPIQVITLPDRDIPAPKDATGR